MDYQTAQEVIAADQSKVHPTAVTRRYYLADAVFLVGLEGQDVALLHAIHSALKVPHWPLSLGRKSYLPSPEVYLRDGVKQQPLREALLDYSYLGRGESSLGYRMLLEDTEGSLRMDQPISSFVERRFGARFVKVEFAEVERVPEPTHS